MKARLPEGYRQQGGMNNILKQAQKLQEEMAALQEELEAKTYTATAGGGLVTAVASGKRQIVSVEIKPEAVDPDDIEMLQDLVVAACNEALDSAERESAEKMGALQSQLQMPF